MCVYIYIYIYIDRYKAAARRRRFNALCSTPSTRRARGPLCSSAHVYQDTYFVSESIQALRVCVSLRVSLTLYINLTTNITNHIDINMNITILFITIAITAVSNSHAAHTTHHVLRIWP